MAKKNLYTVHYEGWLTIEAEGEEQATEIANAMLAKSGIINDGDSGGWELTDVTDEEYWSN